MANEVKINNTFEHRNIQASGTKGMNKTGMINGVKMENLDESLTLNELYIRKRM